MNPITNIRTRLEETARRMGGNLQLPATAAVDLLSAELERIQVQWSRFQAEAKHASVRDLAPEISRRARPGHAVARWRGALGQDLSQEDELDLQGHYLAPLVDVSLPDMEIDYHAYGDTLTKRQNDSPYPLLSALHPAEMWVGIKAPEEQACCLYLHQPENAPSWQGMALGLEDGHSLPFEWGFPDKKQARAYPGRECLHMVALEQEILDHYQHHFLSIPRLPAPGLPDYLASRLDTESQAEGLEDLRWIRLIPPQGITPQHIRQTELLLHCFPVVNRKVGKGNDFNAQPDGVALMRLFPSQLNTQEQKEHFLGLQRVWSAEGDLRPLMHQTFKEASKGTFSLQYARMEGEAWERGLGNLESMVHILECYDSAIAGMANVGVSLREDLNKLLRTLGALSLPKLSYFLHVKPHVPNEHIMVRWWLTQGDQVPEQLEATRELEVLTPLIEQRAPVLV